MALPGPENFLDRTRDAKKVMVLDLGFLGDTVHLLPALWMARQAYPRAELHAAVASHALSVMKCAPWVDRVWGYRRYPRHATFKENLDMIRALRRERFDALINLNGSDRSSWLSWLSGARERLGRTPQDGGPPFWKRLFTARVQYPSGTEPLYLQRCRCLQKAGFPFSEPEFHVEFPPGLLQKAEISDADRGTYFHMSPFTTADYKELSPRQLSELIGALAARFPEMKLALSCAPTPREQAKMDKLLDLLPQRPWRLFAGTLDLIQIAAVIKNSALHFCGDTGTLHLAVMTQTPVVAWFWPNPGIKEWVSTGETCRVIVGSNPSGESFLCGISSPALIHAAGEMARSTHGAS